MLRVLVTLAILAVAVAIPANCNTNDTLVCQKEKQSGCDTNSNSHLSFACATGTECHRNVCVRRPRHGEGCTNSGADCWDGDYDISCENGVCSYMQIYGPGEKCQRGKLGYVNGGCLEELECDPEKGICSGGVAAGQDCDDDEECPPHTYCDDKCVLRKPQGAACDSNYECEETLICPRRSGICQAPFAQLAGDHCSDALDCVENTRCQGGVCVSKVADGLLCSDDALSCPDDQTCECRIKTHSNSHGTNYTETFPAKCVNDRAYTTKKMIDAYKDMQKCAKNSNCHDIWAMNNMDFESGPNQCIHGCLKSGYPTRYHRQGLAYNTCDFGGAAFVIPSIAVLFALLFALFAQG